MLAFFGRKRLSRLELRPAHRSRGLLGSSMMPGRPPQARTAVSRTVSPTVLVGIASFLLALSSTGARAQDAPTPGPRVAAPEAHAIVIQESNGFPGGDRSGEIALQNVGIESRRLRLLDREHEWALFVDLERRTVREADLPSKTFVERPFAFYEKYRAHRAKNLADQADEFRRGRERREGDPARLREWIDQYRRAGGDPDHPGQIVARLQHFPQDQAKTSLKVDGQARDVTLEHYVIRENQGDTPVFDLWVTPDVALPVDLLRFYGELGTFSPEVSARLSELQQKVSGCVVKATVVLDTGTLKKTFRSQVVEVRLNEPTTGMTLPEGVFKQVDPDARAEEPEAAGPARPCEVCGKPIAGDPVVFRSPFDGTSHYLDTTACRVALIKRLTAAQKKPEKK